MYYGHVLIKRSVGLEQKLLQDLISLEETLLQHEQHLRENIIRSFKVTDGLVCLR